MRQWVHDEASEFGGARFLEKPYGLNFNEFDSSKFSRGWSTRNNACPVSTSMEIATYLIETNSYSASICSFLLHKVRWFCENMDHPLDDELLQGPELVDFLHIFHWKTPGLASWFLDDMMEHYEKLWKTHENSIKTTHPIKLGESQGAMSLGICPNETGTIGWSLVGPWATVTGEWSSMEKRVQSSVNVILLDATHLICNWWMHRYACM